MPNREQAERIDFGRASDEGIDPWKRAVPADVDLQDGNAEDAWRVRLDDGDRHEVLLAGVEGEMYGACDCDGWAFHRHEWEPARPCAHLSAVRQGHALADVTVPETFAGSTVDREEMDVDVVKPGENPDVDTAAERIDEDSEPTDDVVEDVPQPAEQETASSTRADTFAGVLEDIPERFVMELDGDPYIRREGWAHIAHQAGLRVEAEVVTWASETDLDLAEARATVRDQDGDVVATGSATAYRDCEDLLNAHANLNELAETRAITRALSWATGAGASLAEVSADQDDLAGVDHDRPEARADGGR